MTHTARGHSLRQPIAVLHGGALGDCALAVHFAVNLGASWNAPVTLIARSPLAKWAERHGLISRGLSLDEVGAHRWFAGEEAAPRLRHRQDQDSGLSQFDPIVSFLGGPEEPITRRIRAISGRPVLAVDPQPNEKLRDVHITEQWARQVEAQGGKTTSLGGAPQPAELARASLRAALASRVNAGERRTLLIHPGSGGQAKCCPIDALELLMRGFKGRNWRAAWMIGPDEAERDGTEFIQRLEKTAPLLFEESVAAAADLAAGADAYIGNDAGMTHVAALAGVATVALFGPTDPRIWRPLGARVHAERFPDQQQLVTWAGHIIGCIEGGSA